MKKYTVIYGTWFNDNKNYTIEYKHIKCKKIDLNKTIKEQIGWENVWFVFDGHVTDTI